MRTRPQLAVARTVPAPAPAAVLWALVLAVLASLSGCNIVAPIAGVAAGRGTQDALYTLNPELPTLIYVDDRASKLGRSSLRVLISAEVGKTLLERELVTDVISSQGAVAFARTEPPEQPYTVEDIGESVGAEQIIYVEIDGFGLTVDGVTLEPTATARVRVVVVGATPARVWPEEADAWQVGARPRQRGDIQMNDASRRQLQDSLALELADSIAKLFYKHENPYMLEREGR
jgi:hypothetical protein